ncbi:MAG: hypothetical protein CM1200mP2_20410 [Planctomycetaceae bacterium]|nr:MAG: hypothetical protein CM1200mP2_20410 [Planctomycetaceae bacterium]
MARKQDCLFVDLLAASGHADWIVHFDGIHQSDLGPRGRGASDVRGAGDQLFGVGPSHQQIEKAHRGGGTSRS